MQPPPAESVVPQVEAALSTHAEAVGVGQGKLNAVHTHQPRALARLPLAALQLPFGCLSVPWFADESAPSPSRCRRQDVGNLIALMKVFMPVIYARLLGEHGPDHTPFSSFCCTLNVRAMGNSALRDFTQCRTC